MGGRLWVESVPGCGSIFQFTVPLAAANDKAAAATLSEWEGWRILIVDDSASQRRILAEMLVDGGADAETAASAEAALAALRRADAGGVPFRAVLLDAGMAGASRVAAAAAGAVVLLRAAQAGPSAPDESAGLVKPVKPSELAAALRRAAAGAAPLAAPPEQGPRLSRSLRVLIAEDHPINQKVSAALVQKLGCSTRLAGNGEETLAALEREPFDAVLMDLQMPGMDGLATTAHPRRRGERSPAHSDHRPNGARPEGRPGAMPGRRHGRLPRQAGQRP